MAVRSGLVTVRAVPAGRPPGPCDRAPPAAAAGTQPAGFQASQVQEGPARLIAAEREQIRNGALAAGLLAGPPRLGGGAGIRGRRRGLRAGAGILGRRPGGGPAAAAVRRVGPGPRTVARAVAVLAGRAVRRRAGRRVGGAGLVRIRRQAVGAGLVGRLGWLRRAERLVELGVIHARVIERAAAPPVRQREPGGGPDVSLGDRGPVRPGGMRDGRAGRHQVAAQPVHPE